MSEARVTSCLPSSLLALCRLVLSFVCLLVYLTLSLYLLFVVSDVVVIIVMVLMTSD